MEGEIRDREVECSSLFPVVAASATRATQLMFSLLPPFGRLGRCTKDLIQGLSSLRELKAGNMARSLLIVVFSVLALVLSYAGLSMDKAIARKLHQLYCQAGKKRKNPTYNDGDLGNLPEPVQRFFRYALTPGQPVVTQCKLKQTGEFRLRAGPGMKSSDAWKPVEATETFFGQDPGFVWVATIQLAPFVWLKGWDSYVDGKGHMFWKLLSALTLVNFGGPEIDRGGLARYLSETVFFPTALLPSENLQWESVGVDSARAVLSHEGNTASAVFHFNELGQVTRLQSTDRPRRLDDGSSTEDRWTGYYRDYRLSDGMNVPHYMEADWNLMSGDCRYAKLQVVKHECVLDRHTSVDSRPRRISLGQRFC